MVHAAAGRGGQVARLLGPVGCDPRGPCTPGLSTWSSSRSLRGPAASGSLVSERASRLDAFSAYPVPTWLPGGAPSGTAGTPEGGPPQSSRTRGGPSQVSKHPRQIGTDLSHDGLNPARVPLSLANSQTLGTFSS